MKATLKSMLVAGAMSAFMAVSGGEAGAEPALSSWYGPGFGGGVTASGEVYRAGARTAAHPSLPFGTRLLVTYGERQVVVEVNDRGPYVGDRDIDLSQAAADDIGLTAAGTGAVDVRSLADSGYERASRKDRDDRDDTLLFERPYLKILCAGSTLYSKPSADACQELSTKAPHTPRTGR